MALAQVTNIGQLEKTLRQQSLKTVEVKVKIDKNSKIIQLSLGKNSFETDITVTAFGKLCEKVGLEFSLKRSKTGENTYSLSPKTSVEKGLLKQKKIEELFRLDLNSETMTTTYDPKKWQVYMSENLINAVENIQEKGIQKKVDKEGNTTFYAGDFKIDKKDLIEIVKRNILFCGYFYTIDEINKLNEFLGEKKLNEGSVFDIYKDFLTGSLDKRIGYIKHVPLFRYWGSDGNVDLGGQYDLPIYKKLIDLAVEKDYDPDLLISIVTMEANWRVETKVAWYTYQYAQTYGFIPIDASGGRDAFFSLNTLNELDKLAVKDKEGEWVVSFQQLKNLNKKSNELNLLIKYLEDKNYDLTKIMLRVDLIFAMNNPNQKNESGNFTMPGDYRKRWREIEKKFGFEGIYRDFRTLGEARSNLSVRSIGTLLKYDERDLKDFVLRPETFAGLIFLRDCKLPLSSIRKSENHFQLAHAIQSYNGYGRLGMENIREAIKLEPGEKLLDKWQSIKYDRAKLGEFKKKVRNASLYIPFMGEKTKDHPVYGYGAIDLNMSFTRNPLYNEIIDEALERHKKSKSRLCIFRKRSSELVGPYYMPLDRYFNEFNTVRAEVPPSQQYALSLTLDPLKYEIQNKFVLNELLSKIKTSNPSPFEISETLITKK